MVRDFRPETKEKIIGYIREMTDEGFWVSVGDFFGDIWLSVKHFFKYTVLGDKPDAKDEFDRYHREVVDKCDMLIEEIGPIFDNANETDGIYAADAAAINDSGRELLNELVKYTEMATPSGISAVLDTVTIGGISDPGVVIEKKKPEISDTRLDEYCRRASPLEFRKSITYVDAAVCKMDFGTAVLISVFNHDDILLDNLIYSRKDEVDAAVRKMLLKGHDGLPTVEEIAKELGVSETIVRFYLKNGGIGRMARDLPSGMSSADFEKALGEYVDISTSKIFADQDLAYEICALLGANTEVLDTIKSGTINEYEVRLYKESLAKSLQDLCDKSEFKMLPNTKKITGVINDIYKTTMSGEMGEAFKKIWDGDKYDTKAAAEFLRKYCGISEPDAGDINCLRGVSDIFSGSKAVKDFIKKTQNGADMLDYWISDYTAELSMIDGLIEANSSNPEYVVALTDLRRKYTDKVKGTLDEVVKTLGEKGLSEAKKTFPPLTAAEAAIDLVGEISGAKGHVSAAESILAYATICPEAVDAYDRAVMAVRENPGDAKALAQVRMTFSVMKQTLADYYDAQIDYADGYIFGLGRDKSYQAYLSYQKEKLENLRLGDDYEAISYEKFMEKYAAS